ncbi:unnamed protein product [Mucor fragilis]
MPYTLMRCPKNDTIASIPLLFCFAHHSILMEDLLAYSKYEQALCIAFNGDNLTIQISSNRATEMGVLHAFNGNYALQNKSIQSLLKEYLDAYAKEQDQQNEKEKHSILVVQQCVRQLRQELLQDERIVLENCQIFFELPLGWTCNEYMDRLRALFMETEWIHQNNPKNRLIFSPFIECLIANKFNNLEREKKYLLLCLDDTAIHVLGFQMQSAKELIAVSKKLAASDFLLIPTNLGDSVTIDISDLDRLIYNKVREIVIRQVSNIIQRKRFYKKSSFRFKNDNKKTTRKQHNNMNAVTQPLFSVPSLRRIIERIIDMLNAISIMDKNRRLHSVLYDYSESKAILRRQTCGVLMNNLLGDTSIKGIVNTLICKVKGLFNKYSNVKNASDGIHDVILHCHSTTNAFYRTLFRTALLDANLVDAQKWFTPGINACSGAMQKPFKMIQIANALLPPIVWKDGNSKQLEWTDYNTREEDLLPPNSFYVQAYINDDRIRFILNKVIAVSFNDAVQKSTFTVQEMSVELESIFDSVCDTMWNHLMMPECQRDPSLVDYCDTHLTGEYSAADYYFFKRSIQEMTEKLLQENFVKCNQNIDINHIISISKECSCSLQISFRTLVDIGLQPAISHVATIIASSLASNSFFGLYPVSALIIMDDSKDTLLQKRHHIFEKTMQRCLQAHHGRTIVFYSRETVMAACESLGNWCTGLQQVFGKGPYSQVSSTDYVLKFSGEDIDETEEEFEMYRYHSNSLKKGDSFERPNEFAILEKGHALDPGGLIHLFYQKNTYLSVARLDLCILNRHKDKVYCHSIWYRWFGLVDMHHPFIIRVTPQHHVSAIGFEVSYTYGKAYGSIYPAIESFSIQERLCLK